MRRRREGKEGREIQEKFTSCSMDDSLPGLFVESLVVEIMFLDILLALRAGWVEQRSISQTKGISKVIFHTVRSIPKDTM